MTISRSACNVVKTWRLSLLTTTIQIRSHLPYLVGTAYRSSSSSAWSSVSCFDVRASQSRRLHVRELRDSSVLQRDAASQPSWVALPLSCPGCGGLTQWVNRDEAGFYSVSRKSVKAFLLQSRIPNSSPSPSGTLPIPGDSFPPGVGRSDTSLETEHRLSPIRT